MVIKTQLCAFSESRIYPGHGSMCCRRDGQTFWLSSKKAKSMYNQRKKPQKIAWTQAWRRLHKKNVDNRQKKKVSEQLGQYILRAGSTLMLQESCWTRFHVQSLERQFIKSFRFTFDLDFPFLFFCSLLTLLIILSSLIFPFFTAYSSCTKIYPCRQWYGCCCPEETSNRKEIQT